MKKELCQNCKKQFTIEDDDFMFYERMKVPSPTWCSECRLMRRFLFWNYRKLFRRKTEDGEEIFSSFPAHASLKIFPRDYWWSDSWDPLIYGREYDFSRPFFEQWKDLLQTVPLPAKSSIAAVNSDYCNLVGFVKNAYLCFDAGEVENSAYLVSVQGVKDSFDLYESRHGELSYETIMSDDCNRAFFSFDCENCLEVWFSKDLMGCSYCFGCVNLRNKIYYIFNKPYTKEVYFEKLKSFESGSYIALQSMLEKTHGFWLNFPVKYMHSFQNTNVSGEHIQNSRNVFRSYSIHDGEALKYCQMVENGVTDCYDYTNFGFASSRVYECLVSGQKCYDLRWCWECWDANTDLEYSAFCHGSSHLFGCIGLRKKEHCIFNKQYSKEDYFALREKIIHHMNEMPYMDKERRIYRYGEFFPTEFSPFAYNDTLAQDFFPLTNEEAEKRGYLWREPESKEYQTVINATDLPDHIKDIDNTVLEEVIKCASCGKAYRIIPMELDFLRRLKLPLPRFCPDCRFSIRMQFINPPKFWHAKCQCGGPSDNRSIYHNTISHFHGQNHCPNEFDTSYMPDREEIVYCEQCYNTEVVL